MTDTFRETIVTEQEFRAILAHRIVTFVRFLRLLSVRPQNTWSKRHYTRLVELAHELETHLDDFGARNNKEFSYLTELVASLRGLGKAAIALKHLVIRFPRYQVRFREASEVDFGVELARTDELLAGGVARLVNAFEQELNELKMPVDAPAMSDDMIHEGGPRQILPHNIDEEDVADEELKIAEVATRYLSVLERLSTVASRQLKGVDALRAHILKNLDEEKARTLESQIHSIQSKYDTFIRATVIESQTPALPQLRGHASLALHLLEMGMELIHFYVRHENDIRYEAAKQRIAGALDKGAVLDRIVNFAFHYAFIVLREGRVFAEEVLRKFIRSLEMEFELAGGQVLHARPISLIVRIVNHYGTPVEMEIEGERCNAGSIMEMILTAGNKPNARRLKLRGDARAMQDIRVLFEAGLGESGVASLPAALDYLRA